MKKSSNNSKKPAGKTAGVTAHKLVTCMTCMHGRLHQYGNNPVLAACEAQPQYNDRRFPFVVEVARCQRTCTNYKETDAVKVIEQRTKAA